LVVAVGDDAGMPLTGEFEAAFAGALTSSGSMR
jgi:hypothetical protein